VIARSTVMIAAAISETWRAAIASLLSSRRKGEMSDLSLLISAASTRDTTPEPTFHKQSWLASSGRKSFCDKGGVARLCLGRIDPCTARVADIPLVIWQNVSGIGDGAHPCPVSGS
jgi:hypothetical protein